MLELTDTGLVTFTDGEDVKQLNRATGSVKHASEFLPPWRARLGNRVKHWFSQDLTERMVSDETEHSKSV